ncbi:MAG: UDP-N-acetylmuramoyl-L-alanyl-D-glutamate--2,6-diaminopimelate ligase [Lachnospiraceae bacterium]|jgi:UDP-N-acetylmuramoyl-L-alanyl-D-glutamate--2,6-diaminopimelate ligase|nr:UDP-N-acetylmuramoyl-L-alanyl-D-glutamate--2,6-diaminopimelate ligase [Lachnospiraceae bacterium]MEE3460502.1 UDP-N-acetylmuramoyl-L-alanyl-D-glutamate--2,6-diaminopimelate ligase [Lachnospiraceae bacterium]
MTLKKLLDSLESYTMVSGNEDQEFRNFHYDSRKISSGDAFLALTGTKSDGHRYIPDVLKAGARVIFAEKEPTDEVKALLESSGAAYITTPDNRKALSLLSAAYFDHPAKSLKTIAVTGTKGKTTSTYMIKAILENAGIKTGLIGTIETLTGSESIPSANTTPESYKVQEYFRKMVDNGMQAVVMEVSSQALKLSRVYGIDFDIGVFTNLSPDHIGPLEHASFEEYAHCKGMLFRQCRVGIVNADDENLPLILDGHTCDIETFGFSEKCDIRAQDARLYNEDGKLGVRFNVSGLINMKADVDIPGKFTVYNSLTAISVCRHFTSDPDLIEKALIGIRVKGRVELMNVSPKFTLMIDYAHNAMSLESLLTTLREYSPERLVCLFGCGGNRSRDRRFEMGEISSKLADLTIVTSDNPRFEKPEDIIADIITGVKKADGKYVTIPDRKEAIRYAIENAREGDVIVLAGKGHEDYQEINGVKHHMDERELVMDVIKDGNFIK